MFKQFLSARGGWLACGVVALFALVYGVTAQQVDRQPPEVEALKRASVNGKYAKLLAIIHVPNDKEQYTAFHDGGAKNGTTWAGYTGLPKGHWVYVSPHWYIWENAGQGGVAAPPAGVPADQIKASVNGKYSDLLKVINVPGDQATYGQFNDYGKYSGSSWAGHTNLPPGYWVYVAPNWYIWGKQGQAQPKLNPVPAPVPNPVPVLNPAPAKADQAKAAVNGKYTNLLKVINVPGDQQGYGEFYDWGHWSGSTWAGYDNLPPGYWVYVAPNWFIWEKQGQAQQ